MDIFIYSTISFLLLKKYHKNYISKNKNLPSLKNLLQSNENEKIIKNKEIDENKVLDFENNMSSIRKIEVLSDEQHGGNSTGNYEFNLLNKSLVLKGELKILTPEVVDSSRYVSYKIKQNIIVTNFDLMRISMKTNRNIVRIDIFNKIIFRKMSAHILNTSNEEYNFNEYVIPLKNFRGVNSFNDTIDTDILFFNIKDMNFVIEANEDKDFYVEIKYISVENNFDLKEKLKNYNSPIFLRVDKEINKLL